MSEHPQGFFLFPANEVYSRNHDVDYPFRQESNFYYLSGFDEPGSWLVLAPQSEGSKKYKTILFVQERDKTRELWEGERYGVDRAISVFGADEAYLTKDFEKKLPDLLLGVEEIFYRTGFNEAVDRMVLAHNRRSMEMMGRTGRGMASIHDWKRVLGELRLYKAPEEIENLRAAGKASAEAHRVLMETLRPGMTEFDAESILEFEMKRRGCRRMGYGTIAAGGSNATCLHYTANNEVLKSGDLLLVDAGGESDYYTADITRTFPIGKKFSPQQKAIYELVLSAQKKGIDMVKPGIKLWDIHEAVTLVLAQGLVDLGILKGKPEESIQNGALKRFWPHGTGHWLGMDVHDMGAYKIGKEQRTLEPGMVFTVEPGLYFQLDDRDYPDEYRGIGIRIEDNILVTQKGYENFTPLAPKEVVDIESLRNSV